MISYSGYWPPRFSLIRLGDGRIVFRCAGRSDRPSANHGLDHPAVFGVHRPERAVGRILGLRVLPLSDRSGCRRRICRRCCAGGRSDARPGSAVCPRAFAGTLGAGQYLGRRDQYRIGRTGSARSVRKLDVARSAVSRLADHVRGGHHSRAVGNRHPSQAERARTLASRRGRSRRRTQTGLVRACFATAAGPRMPLLECCWLFREWLGYGGSGSSRPTCCRRSFARRSRRKACPRP